MKRYAFFLFALLFSACDEGNSTPDAVASLAPDGAATLNVTRDAQLDLSMQLAERLNPEVELAGVAEEPKVQLIGDDYYLVTRFDKEGEDGSCFTTAVRLDRAPEGKLGVLTSFATKTPAGDTCDGVNCQGCELLSDDQNRNYCNCWNPVPGVPGWCNHSTGD